MGGCPRRGPVDRGPKGREVSTLPSSCHLALTTQRNKLLSELGAEVRRVDQFRSRRKLHSEKVFFPRQSVVNGQTIGVEKSCPGHYFYETQNKQNETKPKQLSAFQMLQAARSCPLRSTLL